MKKTFTIIFLSLILNGNIAYADLKGVSKMNLLVEKLNPQAASCGVESNKIETSVKYILSNSKINLIEFTMGKPTLYIKANVDNNTGTCYGHINVEVYEYIRHSKIGNFGSFTFFEKGIITSGGQNRYGQFFYEQLEDLIKMLVVEHSESNR
tara:strand:+ start:47 stop:502 length:456 start_codon:yes stop_codon:yes gene_type:complete